MIEKGPDYQFAGVPQSDRGWVFCPEFSGAGALEISPADWETRIFLLGPALLPDSDILREPRDPGGRNGGVSVELTDERTTNETGEAEALSEIKEDTATPVEASENGRQSNNEPPSVCLGTDILTGTDVCWSLTIKGNPHLLVAGLPGMGKTTCLLNICKQMLANSIRPVVFSYHQDIDEKLESSVGSVRFIDFQGLGFNPLRIAGHESITAYFDVAGALRDIFIGNSSGRAKSRIAEIFKNLRFGPGYLLRNLAVWMFEVIASPSASQKDGRTAATGA